MSKLSAAATNIARIEASGRKDVRRRLRLTFKEAESIPHPTYAWAQLTDAERRSLIAYLADDSEEHPEHCTANMVCLAMLLRLENGQKP